MGFLNRLFSGNQAEKKYSELQQQIEELRIRYHGLRREGDPVAIRGQLIQILANWIENTAYNGVPLSKKAIRPLPLDQAATERYMLQIGFSARDIEALRMAAGADFGEKLHNWAQPQADSCGEQLKRIGVQIQQIATQREALTSKVNKLPAGLQREQLASQLQAITSGYETLLLSGAPAYSREQIPDGIRQQVLDRDHGICRYCGQRSMTLHLDHVIPISQGGPTTIDNLVTSCAKCNQQKSGRTPSEAGMTLLPPGLLKRA